MAIDRWFTNLSAFPVVVIMLWYYLLYKHTQEVYFVLYGFSRKLPLGLEALQRTWATTTVDNRQPAGDRALFRLFRRS